MTTAIIEWWYHDSKGGVVMTLMVGSWSNINSGNNRIVRMNLGIVI